MKRCKGSKAQRRKRWEERSIFENGFGFTIEPLSLCAIEPLSH